MNRVHYARGEYAACGWEAKRVATVRYKNQATCLNCLNVLGIRKIRQTVRVGETRGGTESGLGILKCGLCGKPYSEHARIDDHASTRLVRTART